MSEKLTVLEWHKQQAVTNFNATWDLIEKKIGLGKTIFK